MSRRKAKPRGDFTAVIERLSHDGRGVAHVNGKTTFVYDALPGEQVTFQYTQCHSQFDEGQAVAIAEPSANRQTPVCEHFGSCGGCRLQHMQDDKQLEYKETLLLELLSHQAGINAEPLLQPPITSQTTGYRRKARLGVKYVAGKNKVLVGFRERNGRFVTNCNQCEVLHPSVGYCIEKLSALLYQLESRAQIPQIEVAIGDNANAIILRHLIELPETDLILLSEFCQQQQLRLYLQPKGLDSIHLYYPIHTDPLLNYQLEKYQLTLYFKPQQFTQINNEINQKMVDTAIQWLDLQATDHVLDLFCGIGNFSLPLARNCQQVVGVEGDADAVAQATYNAEQNAITNSEFYCANLFEDCQQLSWAKKKFGKILLDPPRSGAKQLIPWIIQCKPSHIVYISCNPITLARDLAELKQHYQIGKICVMDMFPHTQHIETIVLLQSITG